MGTLRGILENAHRMGFSGRIEITADSRRMKVWFVRGEIAHAHAESGVMGWQAIESLASQKSLSHFSVQDELPPARSVRLETPSLLRALTHFEVSANEREPYAPIPLHTRLEERYVHLRSRMTGLVGFEAHVRNLANKETVENIPATMSDSDAPDGDRVIIEQTPRQSRWEFRHRDRRLVLIGEAGLMTGDLLWAGEQLRKELLQIEMEEDKSHE